MYTVGGTVTGLTAAGLVLTDNGGNNLDVSANATTFTFSQSLQSGAQYDVAIAEQPTGESCTVSSGSGTASANVNSVAVACQPLYTIGGTITGLTASGLTLDNNGTAALTVPYSAGSSSSFSFTLGQAVAAGTNYDITVGTQPTGETCSVSGGSGTVSADVTTVAVSCSAVTFTVSGTISGLTTGGLQLQDYSGGQTLAVPEGATTFSFTEPVAYNTDVDVTVKTQPFWDWCTAGSGNFSGPISSNVTDESFACTDATATGSALSVTSTGQGFSSPAQVAVDAAGDVYIADSLNDRIVEITAGGTAKVLLNSGAGLSSPEGVAVNAAGTQLYIADTNNGRVLGYALPAMTQNLSVTGLDQPAGVAIDPLNGDVIVAVAGTSATSGEVVSITTGASPTLQVLATSSSTYPIDQPAGVAVDAAGNIYVANTAANNVVEISASGTESQLPETFSSPFGVAVDSAGDLYVANTDAGVITLVTSAGATRSLGARSTNGTTNCAASPPQFQTPWGVAIDDSTGDLFVSDYVGSALCQLTPSA